MLDLCIKAPTTPFKQYFFFVLCNSRAKYDSYKALGKMPKEKAMEFYVEELKKIIETMSYTDNVAEFMGSISELDGVDVSDLEAVAPDAIRKVRSQPNSPFGIYNIYIMENDCCFTVESIHFISKVNRTKILN